MAGVTGKHKAPFLCTIHRHLEQGPNWLTRYRRGTAGDEIVDEDFRFVNPRRRSNSTGYANQLRDFKTKFDINETDPVFEETIHGAPEEDDGDDLSKTTSSESGRSTEDEKHDMKE